MKTPSLCACMGPPPGEEHCYCVRKARGMDISYYEWSEDDKRRLNEALAPYMNANKLPPVRS